MTPPDTLARPLARRTLNLPPVPDQADPVALMAQIAPAVLEEAHDALQRGETHYTDRPGIVELRTLIADGLNTKYNIGLTAKDITITCGLAEARFVTLKLLAKPETHVIDMTGDPVAGDLGALPALVGATGTMMLNEPASLLVMNAHTRFPIDGDWREFARRTGAYILWDTSAGDGDFHPAQDAELRPRVVTIGSLDATMPGWRVGWMAGSDVAEKLRSLKQSMTICATSVSQWAAVAALKGSGN